MKRLPSAMLAAITPERVTYLVDEKGIDPKIARIDLEGVKLKLGDSEAGLGWTTAQCDAAEVAYKRFLHLSRKFPNAIIIPTRIMDSVWHQHILDTRAYHRDCNAIFGAYFHHLPDFGEKTELEEEESQALFETTKETYLKFFGEDINAESFLFLKESCEAGASCKGRCAQSCFPAGTNVLQAGMKSTPIELIEVGDVVMCYDSGTLVEDTVEEMECPVRDHLYVLTFENGSVLRLTDEHPLYTSLGLKSLSPISTEKENRKLTVGTLKIGDSVRTIDGYQKLVDVEFVEGEVQTYNIKRLTNCNNYFADGFLAHNKAHPNSRINRSEMELVHR